MELSVFLAKLIGLYLLVIALIALFRKKQFQGILKSFIASEELIAFSGILSLIFGLAILISHPIYEWNWRGLITFIGALGVIQGITRIAFCNQIQKFFSSRIIEKIYGVLFGVVGILGAYLSYWGFHHYF